MTHAQCCCVQGGSTTFPSHQIKICLVCHFALAKSQQVWFAVQRGTAHSYSTSNEDPKSTETASRTHISKELWTYKILHTPKSSQKLSTPPISSCLSLNDPWLVSSSAIIPPFWLWWCSIFTLSSSVNLWCKISRRIFVACLEFHVHNMLIKDSPIHGLQ